MQEELENETLTDKIADIIAAMICDLEDYGIGLLRSLPIVVLSGIAAFFLYWLCAPVVFPAIGFWQMLGLTAMGRIMFGPPVTHYHPPLDAQERALLIRHDEDEARLKVVSDD